MRALALPLSLALSLVALPSFAQATRFIKMDVVEKGAKHHHDGPTEVHIRVPLNLAKGLLEAFADQEIHVGGSVEVDGATKKLDHTQKFKVDQLVKLLESAKAGDLLLQVDTNDGTHVKITIE